MCSEFSVLLFSSTRRFHPSSLLCLLCYSFSRAKNEFCLGTQKGYAHTKRRSTGKIPNYIGNVNNKKKSIEFLTLNFIRLWSFRFIIWLWRELNIFFFLICFAFEIRSVDWEINNGTDTARHFWGVLKQKNFLITNPWKLSVGDFWW